LRAFVAIELPPQVRQALGRLQNPPGGQQVKWVRAEGIHLTLKFLGEVEEARVPELTQALTGACGGLRPFRLHLAGLGVFPGPSRPRVAWVGLAGEIDRLLQLQSRVEGALASLGFPPEQRPFTAHLTLARLREGTGPQEARAFGEAFLKQAVAELDFPVEGVSLMRSQLHPGGAVYTRLGFIPLSA